LRTTSTRIPLRFIQTTLKTQIDSLRALRLCGFAALRLCGFAALRLCGEILVFLLLNTVMNDAKYL